MSEEEKQAIEKLNWYYEGCQNMDLAIQTRVVLNLIQKQQKIINKMTEKLTTPIHDKEWVIKYFEEIVNNECKE